MLQSSIVPKKLSTLYVTSRLEPFQKEAVLWVLDQPKAALLFEQGTGKTWITCAVIEQIIDPQFQGLLVVPLNNKLSTWLPLLAKLRIRICLKWEDFKSADCPKILLLHYEALPPLIRKVRRLQWSIIVYDESHKLKSRGSLAARTARKLRDKSERKLILTGTPIDKEPQELWSQFRFLAPEVFGDTWTTFAEQFLRPSGYMGYQWTFRNDKLSRFLRLIRPHVYRVTKHVLGLPALRYVVTRTYLGAQQRSIYDKVSREFVVYTPALAILRQNFEGVSVDSQTRNRIIARNAATLLIKLQQICGGYVITEDGNTVCVGASKLIKLVSLVKKTEGPLVIFCRFTAEVKAIVHAMWRNSFYTTYLTGETPKQDRPEIIRRFQAGEFDVLVCQIRTGGLGIDLFRASTAIFYSFTYSHIDFEQAVSRLHRRGQTKPVTIILLCSVNTIDETIYDALLYKRKLTTYVLMKTVKEQFNAEGREVKGKSLQRDRYRQRTRYPEGVRSRRSTRTR